MPKRKRIACVRSVPRWWARTDVFFYAVIWLIVLLVFGTLAEKDLGLDQAQRRYFSSLFLYMGPIPLPGGSLSMGFIGVGLLCKLLLDPWKLEKAGTLIMHVGALLLLIGGFLTAICSREGSMMLSEGETHDFFSSYHDIELAVMHPLDAKQEAVIAFGQGWLKENTKLLSSDMPFQVTVNAFFKNVAITPQQAFLPPTSRGLTAGSRAITPQQAAEKPRFTNPFGQAFHLTSAALLKEEAQNRPGIIVTVSGADPGENGLYAMVEAMPAPQYILAHGKKYRLELRHAQTQLPFSVQLIQFEKQFHPGTMNARHYQSEVLVRDLGTEWRAIIKMNTPLRYKGYTFYQASFIEEGQEKATILAVVKNAGRIYPYISSLIMCLGLLIHLAQRLPLLIKKG